MSQLITEHLGSENLQFGKAIDELAAGTHDKEKCALCRRCGEEIEKRRNIQGRLLDFGDIVSHVDNPQILRIVIIGGDGDVILYSKEDNGRLKYMMNDVPKDFIRTGRNIADLL